MVYRLLINLCRVNFHGRPCINWAFHHWERQLLLNRSCIILLIGILTTGCIGWTSISEVPEKSDDYRSEVISGQTSRDAVHERLGDPFISEEKIEVYRVLEDPDVTVILPGWSTREVILYALVVYDESDIVDEIDWGIYPHEKEDDPSQRMSEIRSAKLQAGGYYFAAFNKLQWFSSRQEMLLAPPLESHQAFETPPPPGMCSAIVFLKPLEDGSLYERQLYLDGEHVVLMPLASGYSSGVGWSAYHRRVFIKFLVAEGRHELKITAIHSPTGFDSKFECQSGNVFYIYPRHKLVESEPWGVWGKKFMMEGEIEIYNQPIEPSEGWKRLLYYSGKWFGKD